jgi:hypothetical protein
MQCVALAPPGGPSSGASILDMPIYIVIGILFVYEA